MIQYALRKIKKIRGIFILIMILMLCSIIGCHTSDHSLSEYIEIPLDMKTLQTLQAAVDEGHQPGKMDPEQVCHEFLEQSLQINSLQTLELQKSETSMQVYKASFENQPDLEIYLVQPVYQGVGGIWAVSKYRYLD